MAYLCFSLLAKFIAPVVAVVLVAFKLVSFGYGLVGLAAFMWLTRPLTVIADLLIHKIAEVDVSKLSAVALSVICKSSQSGLIVDAKRQLVTAEIRATCPICRYKYGVTDSICIERKYMIFGPFIGRCLQNPQEHKYSFDKDLLSGKRLNS